MKAKPTVFATFAITGMMLVGCEGPSSGPMTPAGSPGTGTNVPMNNTPGLSGTGEMPPANRGTDTRTRVREGVDAGVTGAGPEVPPYAPPSVQERIDEQDRVQQNPSRPDPAIQPGVTPQPRDRVPATQPTPVRPRVESTPPTTRQTTVPPQPRTTPPATAPTTNPSTR